MAHPLQAAFDMYIEKLNKLTTEEVKIKKMLNEFATEMKIQIPFPDISENTLGTIAIHHDEFVGKSASVAVGEYLEKRGNAAKWDEIEEALRNGGYDWNRHGNPEKTRLTIVKNTFTFKYIKQSNAFGLKKWYPEESSSENNRKKKEKKVSDMNKDNENKESIKDFEENPQKEGVN